MPNHIEMRGGEKLEAALAKLGASLGSDKQLRVGFLENATYPDGTKVALVAAVQNWGSPKKDEKGNATGAWRIPPRPFFSDMVRKEQRGWPKAIVDALRSQRFALATGAYDLKLALEQVGQLMVGQLQDSIRDTNAPPLSPKTVARKGFNKPLIDKAVMINSAGYEVR